MRVTIMLFRGIFVTDKAVILGAGVAWDILLSEGAGSFVSNSVPNLFSCNQT